MNAQVGLKVSLFVALVIYTQLALIDSSPATLNDHECKCFHKPEKHNSSQLYLFGGHDQNDKLLATASRLNSTTGKWESINSMPTVASHYCGALAGKQIFLFGGFRGPVLAGDKVTRIPSANSYDCLTDTYTLLRRIPESREGCGAATLKEAIYLTGGATGKDYTPLSSVFRYNIRTDQWSTVQPMNKPRRGHQLVELGGLLYAIGGWVGETSVEVYNATTDRWSFVASTQYKHVWFGATAHKEKIYVLSVLGFEVYSPSTNQWITLNSPNDNDYKGRSLVSMNDKLWAVGGDYEEDEKRTISKSVFRYDLNTARWVKQQDMNEYRTYNTAFVVNH